MYAGSKKKMKWFSLIYVVSDWNGREREKIYMEIITQTHTYTPQGIHFQNFMHEIFIVLPWLSTLFFAPKEKKKVVDSEIPAHRSTLPSWVDVFETYFVLW